MNKYSSVVGLDVHARSITACACIVDQGEVVRTTLKDAPSASEVYEWVSKLPGPWLCGYESGCTGLALARDLNALGCECQVIAVSTLARSAKSKRSKNDAADAESIMAELLKPIRSYSCVWIADEECEAARGLARLRQDTVNASVKVKQHINSFLLTKGIVWNERTKSGRIGGMWTCRHREWLRRLRLSQRADQLTFEYLLSQLSDAECSLDQVDSAIAELSSTPRWKPYVDALSCVKGITPTIAFTVAAEIGDFDRFRNGRSVTSWLGCAPSEHSSGEHKAKGPITKGGNSGLRKLLVESCASMSKWRACKKAGAARQSVAPEVLRIADEANVRLKSKYDRLTRDREMNANKARVAVVAELIRWLWVIGREVQRGHAF